MGTLLYLEPVGGIAGDMFLAAGVDLGVAPEAITRMLAGLEVPGWKLTVTRETRHAIQGSQVAVTLASPPPAHAHRPLSEIERLIQRAESLPERARERALAVFRALGQAEAKIHGVPVEQVEFHEVGAVDAIVDICGAAAVLELLGNPDVFSAPPPLGSGSVRTAHGVMPVPAPATLELLREAPVRFEGVGELVTPTGAALLKALARFSAPPPMKVEKVGYGVGTRDPADRPNVLRASLGQPAAEPAAVFALEANLDDAPPQLVAELVERLLAQGALDAWVAPVVMKKGRPGHLVCALARADRRDTLLNLMVTESTSLGARCHPVDRLEAERHFALVETPYGAVKMKVASLAGRQVNAWPEFEDCRALAAQANVAVKDVWQAALAAYGARRNGT